MKSYPKKANRDNGISREEKRRRILERVRERVKIAYESGDHPIIQAINAYNELERLKGIIYERLEEWYSIYYPEIKPGSAEAYARLISSVRTRDEATEELLTGIFGSYGTSVYKAIQHSNRKDPTEQEHDALKGIAAIELRMSELQKSLEAYIEESARQRMPNITHLIDCKIAAELLGKAGSLERLALMPASTVQLLGAEKALFKHIKYGGRPPKHGVLYKLPEINTAAKEERGRIARIYATKISIASRADAFSKRFIADKLKSDLEAALKAPHRHGARNEIRSNERKA